MQNVWEMLNRLINPKPRKQNNAQGYRTLKAWEECLLEKAIDIIAASTVDDCVVSENEFGQYATLTFQQGSLIVNKNHTYAVFSVSIGKPGNQAVVTCGRRDKHFGAIDRAFHNMLHDKQVDFIRRALAETNHDV